jgi:hypothetical protein
MSALFAAAVAGVAAWCAAVVVGLLLCQGGAAQQRGDEQDVEAMWFMRTP